MFRNNHFYIMNKDRKLARIICERDAFNEAKFTLENKMEELPFWIDSRNLKSWIENRRAPKHRKHIEGLLQKIGCSDLEGFVRVTHASSLNDSLWIKPVESALKWTDISLFQNQFDENIARIAFEGGLYGEQFSTTSPELSTDGTFAKCWIREDKEIYLMKQGSSGARNAGLEPYSEMYASELAQIICPDYVTYDVVKYRGKLASRCRLFTDENTGFLPSFRYLENTSSTMEKLEFFSSIGSEEAFRRMIVLDALILNTDRHPGNYGVLFDTETYEPIKMAPVFDHNQALLPYAETEDFEENRAQYLAERPVRIGNDFNEVAHIMLTPEIKSDLKNLRGFKFSRDAKYALPEGRLLALEKIIDIQIGNILQDIRLYIEPDMSDKSRNAIE